MTLLMCGVKRRGHRTTSLYAFISSARSSSAMPWRDTREKRRAYRCQRKIAFSCTRAEIRELPRSRRNRARELHTALVFLPVFHRILSTNFTVTRFRGSFNRNLIISLDWASLRKSEIDCEILEKPSINFYFYLFSITRNKMFFPWNIVNIQKHF